MRQSQLAVQPHGESDGVPALQRDGGQRVDRQLTGEDREEACQAAPWSCLPVNGVVVVFGSRVQVHRGNEQQVDPHAQVGEGQVAHQKPRDGQLVVASEENQQYQEVAQDGQQADEPDRDTQETHSHDVLARVELVRRRAAVHLFAILTHHIVVAALKVMAGVLLRVFESLAKAHVVTRLPAEVVSVVMWIEVEVMVVAAVLEDTVP